MKYNILGYNQQGAADMNLKVEDLHILRWFADFKPKMKTIIHNNKEYYWLSYKAILEDLPILNIGVRRLAGRMKNLVDLGILEVHLVKHSNGTSTFYRFGDKYKNLIPDSYLDRDSSFNNVYKELQTVGETNGNSKKTFALSKSEYELVKPIIEYWNSKENLTKHKFPDGPEKECSQTVYRTAKMVEKIISGEFYLKLGIPADLKNIAINRDFDVKMIIDTIELLNVAYRDDMKPTNKNYLPKDIKTFLYNPRTTFSYFLKLQKDGLQEIKKSVDDKLREAVPDDVLKLYEPLFKDENAQTKRMVLRKLPELIKFYDTIDKDLEVLFSDRDWNGKFGNAVRFCKQHVSYLKEYYRNNEHLTAGHLNTHGKVWEAFLAWNKDKNAIWFDPNNNQKIALYDRMIAEKAKRGEITIEEANEVLDGNGNPYRK